MESLLNILINTNENQLRLANIYYSDVIREIKYLSDEFDWSDINTKIKLNDFSSAKGIESQQNQLFVMPGGIDPHVHFDTPGFEFREDFEHASKAAAVGGVTTIIDMPCTSIPPVTNLKNFNTKLKEIKNRSLIDFAFWGGISGTDFNDLSKIEKQVSELAEAGVAGFKVYVISGMNDFTDLTYSQIKQVAEIVKLTGKPLAVHAEDKKLVTLKQNLLQQQNKNSWSDYCASRDIEAEVTAVKELIKIAKKTKCRIHIVHLSSGEALKLISDAKQNGISISTETCPHYLHFTQDDFKDEQIRNFLKTAPPIKFAKDREMLWEGLANNEVDFITTDHAGCNPLEEKISTNFWEVYGGIPGVEHRVPYLLSEGFLKNKITLEQTINLLSANAAEYFQLSSKGKLEVGQDADFALIDLWNSNNIHSENMMSKGKYTPFEGSELKCTVQKTILRGEVIFDKAQNRFTDYGTGQIIRVN